MLIRVEDLEDYVDNYYYLLAMENNSQVHHTSNPNKWKKKDSATNTVDLQTTHVQVSVLQSIHKKLNILSMLHQEIKDLRSSLEFTYNQITDLQTDNTQLHITVKLLTSQTSTIQKENKTLKETILDIQTQSMRDNLISSGIPESMTDNPNTLIHKFMQSTLKLS